MMKFNDYIENEAVPSMGIGASPENPDNEEETRNDSSVLNKELGISDQDAKEVDRTKTFLCHSPIIFPEDGVKVLGPTDVRVEPIGDNDNIFKITVYATNPRKIQDLNGNDYKGDKLEFSKEVSKKTVEALKAQGWNSGGGMMGGMMGGMGGMGGGMGGMPPMMSHTEYPTFHSWVLKETGTSTACVASFARPIFSKPVRRIPKKKNS